MKLDNKPIGIIIDAVYKGYVSHSVVAQCLVISHVKHVCVLLPLVRPYARHVYMLLPLELPHVKHTHLGLHITVSLKGGTTQIWCFGCGFSCRTTMGYVGFKLSFGIIIVL